MWFSLEQILIWEDSQSAMKKNIQIPGTLDKTAEYGAKKTTDGNTWSFTDSQKSLQQSDKDTDEVRFHKVQSCAASVLWFIF